MELTFIDIPSGCTEVLGAPDPGTRLYRAAGPDEGFEAWCDLVANICRPEGMVSPGGVAMFVKASRTAVYKRLSKGQLTGFFYHRVKREKSWWRQAREAIEREPSYGFVPVMECRQWAEILRGKRAAEDKMRGEPGDMFISLNNRRMRSGKR